MSTKNQSERIEFVQNIGMLHWLKPIISFFFSFLVTQSRCFFSCLCLFYHELVNERVSKILRLTKMQEGEDAQKHTWDKNIWSNEYVKSLQC